MQMSGPNARMMPRACRLAVSTCTSAAAFFRMFFQLTFRWKPETVMLLNANPAAGTSVSSMPPLAPTYRISASGCVSRR